MNDLQLSRFLGWASVGIAALEFFGKGKVEEDLLGIDEHPQLMNALAARELAAGVTILSQTQVTPTLAAGLWSRVAGDAMDLALLGMAAAKTRKPAALSASTAMVIGITIADIMNAIQIQRRLVKQQGSAFRQSPPRKPPVKPVQQRPEIATSANPT